MNRKVYTIILIWMVALIFIYFFSKQKITEYTKYKYVEGIINNVVCLQPEKSYLKGSIQIFYNNNNTSIKIQILENNNFDKECKKIKKEIKVGMRLKAQIYNTLGLVTVGNVFINNKKIRDLKDIKESSRKSSNIGIYITILIALLITILKLLSYDKKIKNHRYTKKVFYFLGIWAVIKSLFGF